MSGKKSQVGETATWLVATAIILIILAIAIFASSSLGKLNHEINFDDENLLLKNSLHSYLLTKDGDETSFERIGESGNFDEFTGSLERTVFEGLYEDISTNLRLRKSSEVIYSFDFDAKNVIIFERNKINEDLNAEIIGKNEKTTAAI